MFEKDVHALVQHVTGDFDDLLMHVLVGRYRLHRKIGAAAGKRDRIRTRVARVRERSRDLRIALRRPEPDRNVIGGEHDRHGGFKR